jgi:hypothetical protein
MRVKLIAWEILSGTKAAGILISHYGDTAMVMRLGSRSSHPLYCSFEVEKAMYGKIEFSDNSKILAEHLLVHLPDSFAEIGTETISNHIGARIVRCAGELCYSNTQGLEELEEILNPQTEENPQSELRFG